LARFPRYYIDMTNQDFQEYRAKFSAKTRSTLVRKIRKFSESNGGRLRWERFSAPEEVERFWHLAREVSAKTYQERLLEAGLPDDAGYRRQALQWAAQDRLRAFLLFHGEQPVSYLFCPIRDGIVEYAYLGYDPAFQHLSPGTVLQWLALESLFAERRFRFFDFTEGESPHKRLFSTGQVQCANVALLRPTLSHHLLVVSHVRFTQGVEAFGRWLERHDLKRRVRRWLRFRLQH
jgi:CelD/BcsL family acetyltransferase involved in cellulose biosynthesis